MGNIHALLKTHAVVEANIHAFVGGNIRAVLKAHAVVEANIHAFVRGNIRATPERCRMCIAMRSVGLGWLGRCACGDRCRY